MIKPILFAFLFFWMTSVRAAHLSQADFPKDLLFLGKPIDALWAAQGVLPQLI